MSGFCRFLAVASGSFPLSEDKGERVPSPPAPWRNASQRKPNSCTVSPSATTRGTLGPVIALRACRTNKRDS